MWFRVALLIGLLSPASAFAQSWTVCIDPRTGGLDTEGLRTVREAAAAQQPGRFVNYRISRSTRVATAPPPSFRVVILEVMYAGVGSGYAPGDADRSEADLPESENACFEIRTEEAPPLLSHYRGIWFEHGSAVVPRESAATLEYVIPGYLPGRTVYRLDGYADTSGSGPFNDRLSAARTEAVARELVRFGVRWDDIQQNSFGERNLARPTADGVAEPLNRRVSVDVRVRSEVAR